jgi:hypothetical protein
MSYDLPFLSPEAGAAELLSDDRLAEWFNSRPQEVQSLVRRFPPNTLWLIPAANVQDAYTPIAYNENGTLTLRRLRWRDGRPIWETFGHRPEDLVECIPLPPWAK